MGNCNFQSDQENEHMTGMSTNQLTLFLELNIAIGKNQFSYHYPIGKGGFGKVWRVDRKKDR
jgi:hypothetical protein